MLRLLIFLFLFITTSLCFSQVEIKGRVFSNEDDEGLPGANVVEKGTNKGALTDMDGNFTITVSNPNSTLEISFIGFITKEYKLNGEDSITMTLKVDCIRDYFDTQSLTFYALSGVINTPIGGKMDFAFPAFSRGTLISGIGYQTNFEENEFLNAKVEYRHFIFNCDFDIDANWYLRKVSFNSEFESMTNSIETNFNYNNFRIITGYSHLRFDEPGSAQIRNYSAPVVGLGSWIYTGPIHILITGKTALYGKETELIGQATFYTKYVEVFFNYYQINSYSEFTIGIGKEIGYWLKSQKEFKKQNNIH